MEASLGGLDMSLQQEVIGPPGYTGSLFWGLKQKWTHARFHGLACGTWTGFQLMQLLSCGPLS